MKKISLSSILLLLILLVHCDSDDDENRGSVTFTIDNVEFSILRPRGQLSWYTMTGVGQRALAVWGEIGNKAIGIQVSNLELQNPPDNAVFSKEYDFSGLSHGNSECVDVTDTWKICEGGDVSYAVNHGGPSLNEEFYYPMLDNSVESFIKITSCNGQYASGEFQAKMESSRGNEVTISGVFKDVPYKVNKN